MKFSLINLNRQYKKINLNNREDLASNKANLTTKISQSSLNKLLLINKIFSNDKEHRLRDKNKKKMKKTLECI